MVNPSRHPASPAAMLSSLLRHRGLIASLTQREIASRYRGSALGILWSIATPLLMLSVYAFVFGKVFQQKVDGGPGSPADFALWLFAGLLVFNMFSECVSRAPSLILSNTNYVKRVVFPLEVLPVVTLLAALFHLTIGIGVWVLLYAVMVGVPAPSLLLLPLVLVPAALVTLALAWFLASLGVFVRDVAQAVGVVVMVLMFLSPIFFPLDRMPEQYRPALYLSPLTVPIELAREVMFWGRVPSLVPLAITTLAFAALAWLCFAFFQKTRRGFADVL